MTDSKTKENFRNELHKSYLNEYEKILGEYPPQIEEISNMVYSSLDRYTENIQTLKYIFAFPKVSYNTTVFKVTRKRYDKKYIEDNKRRNSPQADRDYDSTTAVYAYLYSDENDNFTYFCYGPTFRSQDGEYRGRFLPYAQLAKLEEHFSEALEQVEEFVVEKMNSREFEFHVDFCFMKNYAKGDRFQDKINESRLVIRFFMLAWFCDFHRIYMKVMENHMNPAYQHIIFDKDDIPVYNAVAKTAGNMEIITEALLQSYIPNYKGFGQIEKPGLLPLYTGQKIFPVTIREAINPTDITFPAWREIYITLACGNLCINAISPSFPIINNWFYIQGAHAGIFDNLSQYKKYKDSKTAADISEFLHEADRLTFFTPSEYKSHLIEEAVGGNKDDSYSGDIASAISSGGESEEKHYKSAKFDNLSRKINGAILYNESSIRLSEAAILFNIENVGRTFRDLPPIIISLGEKSPPGYADVFTKTEMYSRYMFDAIYAIYSMNIKLWMIHGDVHLNNITLFRMFNNYSRERVLNPALKSPFIVFGVANGEAETEKKSPPVSYYMFEHYGLYTMFIDFSRGIIADRDLIVGDFGEIFAAQYMKKQNDRVMRLIAYNFPSFFEREKTNLEAAIIKDFKLVFKAISAIDVYTVNKHMTEMFKKEVNLKVSPSVIKLAERIRYLAEEVIVKSLKKVVSGTVKKLEEMEWPCYTIIREIFGEFEVDDASGEKKWKNGKKFPEDAQVIDKYSNANPHKYNLQNYEDFPPFMKLEAEEIAAKKVGMEPLPWIARTRAVLAEAEESKAEIYRIADQYREQYSPTDYNEESRWRHE